VSRGGEKRFLRSGQEIQLITLAFLDIPVSSLLMKGFNLPRVKCFNEHRGTLVAELMTKEGPRLGASLPLGPGAGRRGGLTRSMAERVAFVKQPVLF
jgi:hypothetical protein